MISVFSHLSEGNFDQLMIKVQPARFLHYFYSFDTNNQFVERCFFEICK